MKINKQIITTAPLEIQVDEIFILSDMEYMSYKDHINDHTHHWWLRSRNRQTSDYDIVDCVGHLGRIESATVKNMNTGISPAIKIKNTEELDIDVDDKFEMAGYIWTIIEKSKNACYAQCDEIISYTPFRQCEIADDRGDEWRDSITGDIIDNKDLNDYEKSTVKQWIDDWAISKGLIESKYKSDEEFFNELKAKFTAKDFADNIEAILEADLKSKKYKETAKWWYSIKDLASKKKEG